MLIEPRPLVVLVLLPPVSAMVALSGLDATVNLLAQGAMPFWVSVAWAAPALIFGMVAPVLVPLVASLWPTQRPLAPRLWTAFLTALILVSLFKALTGRLSPEADLPADLYARSTALTLFSGEILEGWPSGHAATNGAVALTLSRLTPLPWARRLCLGWTLWVWAAVTFGIGGQVHWFSDMLAGAGLAVAISFSLTPRPR